MKEGINMGKNSVSIYKIPVLDAYKEDSECPMCILEKNIEEFYLDKTLGAAMMEPDYRILLNENGFCGKHLNLLREKQKLLPLSLVLDSHYKELKEELSKIICSVNKNCNNGLLSKLKKDNSSTKEILEYLESYEQSCAICMQINEYMNNYIKIIFDLYKNDEDFKALFRSKKGYCLKHLKLLVKNSDKYLSSKIQKNFLNELMKQQITNFDRVHGELQDFINHFDYRFKDEPLSEGAKNSVPNIIQKLS